MDRQLSNGDLLVALMLLAELIVLPLLFYRALEGLVLLFNVFLLIL